MEVCGKRSSDAIMIAGLADRRDRRAANYYRRARLAIPTERPPETVTMMRAAEEWTRSPGTTQTHILAGEAGV